MDDEPVVPRPCSRRQDNRKWELRARPGLRDGWPRIRISGDYGISARSLAFDVGRLDDRPPLFDFGFLVGGKSFWRLLLARKNLLPKLCNSRAHVRLGQDSLYRGIELPN